MALVFQFGSNCSSTRLNSPERLNGIAHDLGLVRTRGVFELCFNVWSYKNDCAAADIRAGAGRIILGVLYDVPDSDMVRFDTVEGPRYQRKTIDVERMDGSPVDGVVYTYTVRAPIPAVQTSQVYVTHILEGLKEHGAPSEYLEYVKHRASLNNPNLKL